jgi:hypothetical protein
VYAVGDVATFDEAEDRGEGEVEGDGGWGWRSSDSDSDSDDLRASAVHERLEAEGYADLVLVSSRLMLSSIDEREVSAET